jgi:hypothetical protein
MRAVRISRTTSACHRAWFAAGCNAFSALHPAAQALQHAFQQFQQRLVGAGRGDQVQAVASALPMVAGSDEAPKRRMETAPYPFWTADRQHVTAIIPLQFSAVALSRLPQP